MLAEDALQRLQALGLLETEEAGAPWLHRLVAAFARGRAPAQAQTAVEETLLHEANRLNNAGYPASPLAWQVHLRTVTDAAWTRENELAAGLCNTLGFHLAYISHLSN